MRRRINITLSEETLALIDRAVTKGNRSQLIDQAVRHFLSDRGKANLRRRLQEGAVARAPRDVELASEWFDAEDETWRGGGD